MTETAPSDTRQNACRRAARNPARVRWPVAGRRLAVVALLVAVGLAYVTGACTREAGQPALAPAATAATAATAVDLKGRALKLTVAADEESRQLHLRFTKPLPEDHGMLLVYQADEFPALPTGGLQAELDAVLIDASGRVSAVRPVRPNGAGEFLADVPARYVLLVNRGLPGEAGVAASDVVAMPEEARRAAEPRTEVISLGGRPFRLEVAATDAARQKGLMRRPALAADGGMIFVFPREQELGFWMKNTAVPLDIIYVDAGGRVASVKQMAPYDLGRTSSDGLAKYAIELNRGTAARIGLKAGDRIDLPARVRNPPDLE